MKKLLAILLSLVMVVSLFAACSGDTEETNPSTENTEPSTEATTEATEAPVVEAEALPDAFVHLTFDGDDEGYTALVQTDDVGDNTGATYGLAETSVTFAYSDGPVDQCIYLDGTYGLDLGFDATDTTAYTVSFWVNASRLASYGPTLQIGHNIGMADNSGNDVTWMNVTQTEFSVKYFPTIWSRNEASDAADGTDCWPWMSDFAVEESIYGKKEWAMITIVCSGEEQASPLGSTTVGAQLYINGTLVYDSAANYSYGTYFEYTWDATLAPNIMQAHDNFEAYFGINYWDTVFKGFLDDLYVYDVALTAGQVQTLWQMGDATVESAVPETGDDATAETDPTSVTVEITGTALGATDYSTGFWSEFSDVWAVPSGESVTVTFRNFHDVENASNWNNFVAILQNVAAGHSVEDDATYAEYAVVRADNYGWGSGYDEIATAECDWDWSTYAADLDGATVVLTVTNNGTTADIAAEVTTMAGTVYHQTYTGIAVTGDVYLCLTVDGCCLDIISVE